MATKICPHCGEEKDTRGFHIHVKVCKDKMMLEPLRKQYAHQIASMKPEQADRFLRKAGGLT